MKERDEFLGQLKQFREATFPFFAVYSRFEYALKREGYLERDKTKIKINWAIFKEELGHQFFDNVKESGIARTIISDPSKKQICENNKLSWENAGKIENTSQLIEAIGIIRNNLFHGGKFPCGPIEDPTRNEKILAEAIDVVFAAIRSVPKLRNAFIDLQ